jgi:Tol biopolymer transport system component
MRRVFVAARVVTFGRVRASAAGRVGLVRLVILGASALALLALAGSGTAAYPGSNGKIAFARNGQIYVTNPDGSGTTAVTAPPDANNDAQPAVSPDGRKIAFVSQRGGGRDIWVAGIDGSNPTQLTRDGTDGNPTWSPNGRQIAFDSGRTGLTTTIWVMDADGTNPPRKVVDRYPVSNVEDPAWSPGGTELAYVLSNPAPAIAVASATDGTGERVVAGSDAEWDRDPSWAPDGTAIAYQRTNTSIGQSDIYAVALATNGKTQLTNDAAPDEHPAYSPDGRQIVYASNRGGRSRLIRMGADGSGPIDLTSQTNNPDAADRDPDWGPAMVETPSLSINDISVTEGNSGTTDATFTVSLSAATSTDVSVDYATADGTATAPSDYASTSGTLTIPTGATSRTITVPVVGDTVVEPDETFTVALSNAANATIAKAQGTGTIVNDDSETPPPSLSIDDVSVPEGDAGSTNAVFTISLSAATTKDVSVHYDTADGSATAGSDYTATSGDAVIPLGQTSTTVSVAVLGDTVVEGDETFTVNLSSPSNATLGRAQATGTIVDDDGGPVAAFTAQPNPVGCEAVVSFDGSASSDTNPGHSIVSYDWSFGDGATATGPVVGHAYTTFGSCRATLRVTDDSSPARSDSTSKVIDVSVDRAPKAAAGGPYVIELGDSLSLYGGGASDPDVGCGDSIQSYSWDLNGDGVADATTASPTFSAAELANLGLGVGTHTATLTVTDSFGTSASASAPFEIRQAQVSIAGTSLAEGDSGNTDAALPVTLSFSSTHTVTVDYATADGTATAGSDYMATSGTLTFAPGTTTQTIHVPVTGDTTVEPDETFDVVLSNVS